jgi:2-hydroxy-6-oxonona-2,4-dienedioate hydrolase
VTDRCELDIRAAACEQLAELDSACERIEQPILGQQMVWRRVGQGKPLVLLHGGHGSWLHWARVIPALSSSFSLWIPDMPGYGESTLTPTGGLDQLVAQLRQSLDGLLGANTPFLMGGFSFGGLVSARLAAQRPHVERMVLIGPAGHGGQRRQTSTLMPWRSLSPDGEPREWAHCMRHNLLAQMLHADSAVDGLAMEIQWRSCLNTRFRSKPFSRSAELAPSLRAYPGVTLEIWGEYDVTAVPNEMVDVRMLGDAPRSRHIVDGGGHWLMHENAAAVVALMKSGFLVG